MLVLTVNPKYHGKISKRFLSLKLSLQHLKIIQNEFQLQDLCFNSIVFMLLIVFL